LFFYAGKPREEANSDVEAYAIGKRVDKKGSNCNPKTKEKLVSFFIFLCASLVLFMMLNNLCAHE
jgi:hypothetical protein